MNSFQIWLNRTFYFDVLYKNLGKHFLDNYLRKVVVRTNVTDLGQNKKLLAYSLASIRIITNQKPLICKTKKAVSFFKIKKDMRLGAKVTLHRKAMYDFIDLFIHIVMPKLDFSKKISDNVCTTSFSVVFSFSTLPMFLPLNILEENETSKINISVAFVFDKKDQDIHKCLLSFFQIPY